MAMVQGLTGNTAHPRSAVVDDQTDATQALLAVEAGELGLWTINFTNETVWCSALTAQILGLPNGTTALPTAAFFDCIHDADLELIYQMIEAARRGDPDLIFVNIRRKPSPSVPADRPVWLSVRARVTEKTAQNAPRRLTGLLWRITESSEQQHRADRQLAALSHRVNNTFAVIRALVNLGETVAKDMASFTDTLRNQVEALAVANKLSTQVTRTKDTETVLVGLIHLIDAALSSRDARHVGGAVTVQRTCPPDIRLAPADLSNMSMVLFELAANAEKHGVFGSETGELTVTARAADNGTLTLSWVERGLLGADVTDHDAMGQQSFGETLLGLCASNLDASYSRTFTDDGMQFEMTMRPQP